MTIEAGIAQIAIDQHGLITAAQLKTLKLTRAQARWRVKSGLLIRLHEGVYRVASVPQTWEQRALAALLIAGEGAALSHRAAAVVHELDGITLGRRIDVTVPEGRRPRSKLIAIHRTKERLPVTMSRGFPVTSLARTLIDLAADATEEELELALDHAQRRRRGVLSWLDWSVGQLHQPRRRGLKTLMELVRMRRDGGTGSVLEVQTWRRLRALGFSGFVRQFNVSDAQGHVLRLDFAWPVLKVALHVDGYAFHSGREQLERDADQRSRLELLGWRQQVVMHATLKDETWVTQLRRKLELAAATNGTRVSGPSPTHQLALFAA